MKASFLNMFAAAIGLLITLGFPRLALAQTITIEAEGTTSDWVPYLILLEDSSHTPVAAASLVPNYNLQNSKNIARYREISFQSSAFVGAMKTPALKLEVTMKQGFLTLEVVAGPLSGLKDPARTHLKNTHDYLLVLLRDGSYELIKVQGSPPIDPRIRLSINSKVVGS